MSAACEVTVAELTAPGKPAEGELGASRRRESREYLVGARHVVLLKREIAVLARMEEGIAELEQVEGEMAAAGIDFVPLGRLVRRRACGNGWPRS